MARRRKAKIELTLFPFLSVLSGLIAVNVLFMIVTISTRVITDESEPPPPSEQNPEAGTAKDAQVVPDGIDAATYEQLDRQIKLMEAALEQRKAIREELRLQLREIASLIAAKELELDKSQAAAEPKTLRRIGEPSKLRVVPPTDPDGVVRKAVFIEVSSAGYIVHPEKLQIPVDLNKRDQDGIVLMPAELDKVFREMRTSKDNRYPIFLVHPNGADAFQGARIHVIEKHPGLRSAWEPFSREYLLDTSK